MIRTISGAAVAFALLAPALPLFAQANDPARLYGRVEAADGTVHQGFIRWDGNESGWHDVLHASKPLPERNRRDAERMGWEPERRQNRLEILGIDFSWPGTSSPAVGSSAESGIRFGHISSLEVTGRSGVRLLLRTGEEVTFDGGGDLGGSVDQILVEDPRRGQVELEWDDVRVIDFMHPPGVRSSWGDRLYGTLVTGGGERFTGYIAWDMDELFGSDILDGEEGDRDVEIPFSRIAAIERFGSGASRVYLLDGTERVLRGSNDVNDDNRDILVADPTLGEVRVEWEAFDRVVFEAPPTDPALDAFGRSGRLRGTVRARGGETHTGWIRWDNDEEFAWELLDGEWEDGVDMDVEMGGIASIERTDSDRSLVTLRDGRSFALTGSNDVDEDNRGIYIERADGTLVLVPWERFVRADFDT